MIYSPFTLIDPQLMSDLPKTALIFICFCLALRLTQFVIFLAVLSFILFCSQLLLLTQLKASVFQSVRLLNVHLTKNTYILNINCIWCLKNLCTFQNFLNLMKLLLFLGFVGFSVVTSYTTLLMLQ